MVFCVVFLVLGVDMLFGLVPFKTCPLFALMFVSPLSFFCCLVVRRRRFLSFFLSQVLGKPKPRFGVWVSPCVSSSWPRVSTPTRRRAPHLHLPQVPHPLLCFFFFLSSPLAWVVSVCGSRGGVWFCLFGLVCWSVWLLVCLVCLAFLHVFLH